jgi:hypothetical protein
VDHLAVARGDAAAVERLGLRDDDLAPGACERVGARQPDHAGSYDQGADRLHLAGMQASDPMARIRGAQ